MALGEGLVEFILAQRAKMQAEAEEKAKAQEAVQANSLTDQLVKTAVETANTATAPTTEVTTTEPITAPEEDENSLEYIGTHRPAPLNKLIGQEFVAMRGMA